MFDDGFNVLGVVLVLLVDWLITLLDIAKRFFEGTEGLIVVAFWNGLLEA